MAAFAATHLDTGYRHRGGGALERPEATGIPQPL